MINGSHLKEFLQNVSIIMPLFMLLGYTKMHNFTKNLRFRFSICQVEEN